jgi:hypothetical protein
MARKAESTFIASIHKHLAMDVHREKMNNPYRSGTADVWYSGMKGDLWVEYKFLPSLPKREDTVITLDLSENQKIWLRNRYTEGRNIAVICGCKAGAVVFTRLTWEQSTSAKIFSSFIRTRLEVAQWIHAQTGAESDNVIQTYLSVSKLS